MLKLFYLQLFLYLIKMEKEEKRGATNEAMEDSNILHIDRQ